MLDAETCAMAFRILQMNGYDVSTGALLYRLFLYRFYVWSLLTH